ATDAAGREHWSAGRDCPAHEGEVGAGQRAVAVDRRHEHALPTAPREGVVDAYAAPGCPASRPHLVVPHVEGQHESLAELEPRRGIGPGRRPDDDPLGACGEERTRVLEAADTAGGLHGHAEPGHRSYELGTGTAVASAVEVDQVDAARAGFDPAAGERNRV